MTESQPIEMHLLALPESAGSALYGMFDVLATTATAWAEITRLEPGPVRIRPRIVSLTRRPFACGFGVPVHPDLGVDERPRSDIIVITDLWTGLDDPIDDRYDVVKAWLSERRAAGATIYSACSGSVLLAAAGLLDGLEATSHWAYEDLFRRKFPSVRFDPFANLCFSDRDGRLVTAGGSSSWHDLALHIISRHVSPSEALNTAKAFLLKWHSEGQLPFANRVVRLPHADSVVRRAENWLSENFCDADPVAGVVAACGVPERSLKRRFRAATGATLIAYAQNLRVEAAKRALETGRQTVDEIAAAVGYENVAFFRRLFKRSTGLSPAEYRRLYAPVQAEAHRQSIAS